MLISELAKKEVLDVNANKVGYLVDVDLNIAQGMVNHYMLKTGVFKKIPVMPDKIDRIGEKVLLNISKSDIEKSPIAVK